MKKIIYFLGLVSMVCSCTSDESVLPELIENANQSQIRSMEEVLSIAENSMYILDQGSTRVANGCKRKIDMDNIKVIGTEATRSVSNGELGSYPLLYVVNFCDSMGYSIISASKNTEGLIAVIENGTYNSECIQNRSLNFYMDCAKRYVAQSFSFEPIVLPADTIILYNARLPLIDAKWKQSGTLGAYCPNGKCGCGPLALLEILGYYKYPRNIEFTFLGDNAYAANLDWNDMMLHKEEASRYQVTPCCDASEYSHIQLGLLAREIGCRSHAIYSDSATSVCLENIENCARGLGYTTSDVEDYIPGCTIRPLDDLHLLIVRGDGWDGGHEWVVDGYRKEIWTITDRSTINLDRTPSVRTEVYVYNHINWGWGGIDNGYFSDGVFAPASYHSLDNRFYYDDEEEDYGHYVEYVELFPQTF